ncbi:hypothetical protein ABH940_005336 [Streptacidiphilus sp. BW17]
MVPSGAGSDPRLAPRAAVVLDLAARIETLLAR